MSNLIAECETCGKVWLCISMSDAEGRKRRHEFDKPNHVVYVSTE